MRRLTLFLMTISLFTSVLLVNGETGSLIFVSRSGTLTSRVFCSEILQCVGTGTDVFWSFFGLGSNRVPNSLTRYTNTSQEVINGTTVITANLTFSPVSTDHQTLYVCQVHGTNPASSNVRLTVETAPVILISDIQDIDLTQHSIGDPITVSCQVETCLSDVTTTFYKGNQVLQTTTVTNNIMSTLTFAYTIIVSEDSAGEYGCRAVTTQGGTPNDIFILTGTPRSLSSTVSPSSTTTSSSSTSSSSTASVMTPVSSSIGDVSMATSPTVSATPTGGTGHVIIQWSLMMSLLIITIWYNN